MSIHFRVPPSPGPPPPLNEPWCVFSLPALLGCLSARAWWASLRYPPLSLTPLCSALLCYCSLLLLLLSAVAFPLLAGPHVGTAHCGEGIPRHSHRNHMGNVRRHPTDTDGATAAEAEKAVAAAIRRAEHIRRQGSHDMDDVCIGMRTIDAVAELRLVPRHLSVRARCSLILHACLCPLLFFVCVSLQRCVLCRRLHFPRLAARAMGARATSG